MEAKTYRTILVAAVVALVLVAGCTGDGASADVSGADGDAGSADGGSGDGASDDGDDESGAGGDGASSDSDDSGAGDGGDGAASDGTPSDGDEPVSSTPTPESDERGVDDGDGDGDGDDSVADDGDGDGSAQSFADGEHTRALAESGSYTLEYTIDGRFAGMAGSETMLVGREEVNLDTGERVSTLESRAEGDNFTFEYYLPANSDTAYQRGMGQVMEVPAENAVFFNFTDPGTGESAEEWPEFREAGSAETAMGPVTKWVVDSPEDLPEATREEYDTIESVEFTVWIDEDTGVIAKYDYRISYVDEGQSGDFRMTIELSDLGSTTVEKPDWAP